MIRHSLPLAALIALGAPALAAPDEDIETLNVQLENLKDKGGQPGGYFAAKGKTQPLKDGTQLQVTLAAVGRSRDFPVKVVRAVVKDRAYQVSKPWKGQVFAPLVYEVKVELVLKKQPKAIQKWIMTEYGYSAAHREVLERRRIPIGTDEERTAFAIQNIENLKGLVGQIEDARLAVLEAARTPMAELEGGQQKVVELTTGLIGTRRSIDGYFRQYVVLLEQGFRARLLDLLRELDRALRDYSRGADGTVERLEDLGKLNKNALELIKQYAPVPADDQPLIPEDEPADEDGEGELPKKEEE